MDADERYGAAVFRALDGDPGPSTVDVARAVTDGERRHRRTRLAASAGVAAAVLATTAAGWLVTGPARPAAPPDTTAARQTSAAATPGQTGPTATTTPDRTGPLTCAPVQLPTPGGQPPKAVVTGADPTGRYIVGRSYPGGNPSTVIWIDRVPHQAPMPGDDPSFHDITSAGVAVGSSFVGDKLVAWAYHDGRFDRLAGADAQAYAINEQGTIVGEVNGKPAIWRSIADEPTMLKLPTPKAGGVALDIDEDGTIVGAVTQTGSGSRTAAMWRPDGTFERLPIPAAHGGTPSDTTARAIRGGWVVGWAATDAPGIRHIDTPRWNLRTGATELVPGSFEVVNPQGWIAGGSKLVAGTDTVPLPGLDGRADDGRTVLVRTISDNGATLAGQVTTRDGQPGPLPVLWTCQRR